MNASETGQKMSFSFAPCLHKKCFLHDLKASILSKKTTVTPGHEKVSSGLSKRHGGGQSN